MALDLVSFDNAIARLREGIALYEASPGQTIIRDGLIPRGGGVSARPVAGARGMNIAPEHLRIVEKILKSHLPVGSSVAVFGSRATGRAKPFSDLDLAIDAGRPLTLAESADLREAFTESDLPWKVDFLDRHAARAHFLKIIEAGTVLLPFAGF